jgi:RNA polymerase sigma-70 factor (ECF subfamily)
MTDGRLPLQLVPASPPVRLELESAFRAYSTYVASVAFRILGCNDEVDDVVQEVFVVALKGLATIREPQAVKAWLATVTVRNARRRLRARRVRMLLGFSKDPVHFGRSFQEAPQEDQALIVRLNRVLNEIPVNQRIAWTLRHMEGESLEMVAKICECSLATAKRRIAAAHDYVEKVFADG